MRNLLSVLDRLDYLIWAVERAQNEFEFAAMYGAIRYALDDLGGLMPEKHSYVYEKIAEIRWHITAAVGYEPETNFTEKQHLLWAVESLSKLTESLRDEMPVVLAEEATARAISM